MMQPITSPKNVVAYRVSGKIEEDDIQKVVDKIESSLEEYPKISFYTEVGEVEGMTFAAFFKNLGEGLKQLKNIDRFERVAVVTEQSWAEKMARLEGGLSSVNIEVFSNDRKDEALTWATEV